ncbi:hypothetical protein RHSIM_Rhsim03G0128700 [Rhododendron simsii]|uniref:Uncharacterized protein n=1 Tax=Rhododendron simsii TaxID=118357 RepID=A0A834H6C4_RHOSS|nr:hypothetical protein RHSIM_Rhsim03G0128700 [Rhododendron simsii]
MSQTFQPVNPSLATMETLPQNPNLLDPQISFGVHSPKHNNSSPACKLQQVFHQEGMRLDKEARVLKIVGHLENELNNSADPLVLDVVTAKLQSQDWILVENGKQKGILQQPSGSFYQKQQNSIVLTATSDNHHSTQIEESSESEDEIQEVEYGAVASKRQIKVTIPVGDDPANKEDPSNS